MQPSDRNVGRLNRCPDALALLPGYVEGELTAAEHRRVMGHLAICAACRQEESQFRQAVAVLRAPRDPQPHGDLYAGFARKLSRYEAGRSRFRMQTRWASAAACVLVVAATASIVHQIFAPAPEQADVRVKLTARSLHDKGSDAMSTLSASNSFRAPAPPAVAGNKAAEAKSFAAHRPDPFEALPSGTGQSSRITTNSDRLRHGKIYTEGGQTGAAPGTGADREEFWKVRPETGPTAAEIIRKQNPESEAVFSAAASSPAPGAEPKPTETYVVNQPASHNEERTPSGVASDNFQSDKIPPVVPLADAKPKAASPALSEPFQAGKNASERVPSVVPFDGAAAHRAAVAKATMALQEQEALVRVNGAMASVRNGLRIDGRGRRILNVNIRMRPPMAPRQK